MTEKTFEDLDRDVAQHTVAAAEVGRQDVSYLFARHININIDWDMIRYSAVVGIGYALALFGVGYTATIISSAFGTNWAGLIYGAVIILLVALSPKDFPPR